MVFHTGTFYRTLLCFLLAFFSATAFASTWDVVENCDIPGPFLQEFKTSSREECQQRCVENQSCKSLVYVSGWNKCWLKAETKKHARLRFISGELDAKHEYQNGSGRADHDHAGKDLQRLVLDQVDKCGQACAENKDCAAFTYLEGYRVCWLKKAGGKYLSKVFSCAFKKD